MHNHRCMALLFIFVGGLSFDIAWWIISWKHIVTYYLRFSVSSCRTWVTRSNIILQPAFYILMYMHIYIYIIFPELVEQGPYEHFSISRQQHKNRRLKSYSFNSGACFPKLAVCFTANQPSNRYTILMTTCISQNWRIADCLGTSPHLALFGKSSINKECSL